MKSKLGLPRFPARAASSQQIQWAKRFRFRFSLRSLLLLVSAIALWLGWLVEGARRQQEAVAIIRGAGGYAGYDYQGRLNSEGARRSRAEWRVHRFLRTAFGDDVMSSVDMVDLGPTTAPDILLRLPTTEVLLLYCTIGANRNPSRTPEAYLKAAVDVVAALPKLKFIRLSRRFTFADAVNMQRAHPDCTISLPGGRGPMTSLGKRFDLDLSRWRENPCVEADGDDYIVYGRESDRGVKISCLGSELKPPLNARVALSVVRCPGHAPYRKSCGLPLARIEAHFRYEDDTWSLESNGWKQTWAAVKVLSERPNVDVASIATELARQFGIVLLDEVVMPGGGDILHSADADDK